MLSPKLLDALRIDWRGLRRKPTEWLFPGNRWHTSSHSVTAKVLWIVCQLAAERTGALCPIPAPALKRPINNYVWFECNFKSSNVTIGIRMGHANTAVVLNQLEHSSKVIPRIPKLERAQTKSVVDGPACIDPLFSGTQECSFESRKIKHMKKIGSLVASVLLVCLVLTGCGGGGSKSNSSSTTTTPTLASIGVSGPASTVAAGSTLELSAVGTYSDNTTATLSTQVAWKTSDATVATVSTSGLLTALKAGAVTVTATQGTISGAMAITVTVSQATLTSISVTGTSSSPTAGTNEQLTAQGTYSDNSTQTLTSQVTWQSSDSTIATMSSSGLLTAVKAGSVTITATMGTVSGTMPVVVIASTIVIPPILSSIAIVPSSFSVAAGQTEQLQALGAYSDGTTQDLTAQAAWSSSASNFVSVSTGGLATGVSAGSANITATLGSIQGTATATVTASVLNSITVTPSSVSIATGQTQQLSALGAYSDGTTQDLTTQASWSSSASNFVTVSTAGLATGISSGSATIIATLGSIHGTATATVTAILLNSITVTPSSASIATGQTQAFTANGIFSDGSTTDITFSVVWSSSATSIATVNSKGLATGSSAGLATITATSDTVTGSAALNVTPAALGSIDISPDGQTIPVGGQVQLTLTGSYSDNTTQDIANAAWSSSDSTTASVDPATGIVTGVANSNGNPVAITASAGGMTTTTTVYVTSAVPESLTLTPATASIASGTTQQYAVNAIYSDGSIQPVLAGLSWSSSSATTAGISPSGLATGLAPGPTTITVVFGALTGTAALTVTPATLTSMVVVPTSPTVGINGDVQFTATGIFTDNSTQDLTSQATWISSAANVALINNAGLATGLSTGTTTITAEYQGISGSTRLAVSIATLVSISITPANPIVPPHAHIQLTAIGTFSDGSKIVLSGVSWRTTSARYAMVSGSGVVRTKKATNQPVAVYAKLNGISGQTTLTITPMAVASLQLTPANQTIAVSTTLPFQLIGTFSDGVTTVDLSKSARWQTSNYRDAVINNSGVGTGISSGSVTITGSYGNLTPATTTLTVSNATIQSISVTPSTPTIILGAMQPFAATGLFSDGSTQDITTISQWTSSAPSVAVVSKTGLATSASHGQTSISATFKGVSGAALLTIN